MPDLVTSDLTVTPGQTIGPFFGYALPYPGDRELVPRGSAGSVRLHGYVYDGKGRGLEDALLEIRQADASGAVPAVPGSLRRGGAPFTGWGRSSTDPDGHYWFSTVEPGPTRPGGAPFLAVAIFARGLLNRLFTRIYLPADPAVLDADPLLLSLDTAGRRAMAAVREADPDLVNAGKAPVTELPGASYFHHADSFAMMRGGHLDICALGAYQVSVTGDLANWHTGQPGDIPAVGGAMDLAIGARQSFVMMTLLTRDGRPKLVRTCTYPLTGLGCVSRVYTDLAVFLIQPGGVVVRDLFGIDFAELTTLVGDPLVDRMTRAAS